MDKKHKHPPQGQQPMYPGIPGLPPGMMPPNTGGRPMVVVMMKGGGQPNLGGLPFMMGGAPPPQPAGKKKKKKGSKGGKKKAKKAGVPKPKKPPGEEDSDSDSDRVNAPDIPAAHTHKPPPGTGPSNPSNPSKGDPSDPAFPSPSHSSNPTSGHSTSGRGGGGSKGGNKGSKGGSKGGGPSNPMASAFGSGGSTDGGGANPSTTSTTSTTGGPVAAGGGGGAAPVAGGAAKGKAPVKKPVVKKAPAKPGIKKENFIIKDGNVDKSCVPAFVLVDGPAGCPIAVPIDARDENAIVNELGPQPLTTAPKETTRGYLVLNEEGLLHFKPQKECKEAPFASTPGQLQTFLTNSNIFIADAGPPLPDEKAYNKASTVTKDKIGGKDIAVSGHVTMVTDKGTCKFTRVVITQAFPFYPHTAAFGVLVRDFSNGYVFFVPTENRFVGMVLSQGVKQPFKPVVEAQIVGNIYKDANGAAIWEVPSEKKENLMGYIMSSGTGVPIYVPKPDDNAPQRAPPPPKKGKAAVTPGAASSATASAVSPVGAAVGGAAPDGTASATVPVGGQPGETAGAVKVVESVTCLTPGQGGGGGVTSMTVPVGGPSDPAAAAAAGAEGAAAAAGGEEKKEGESAQDQVKKMVASQQELPPAPPPEPEAAAPKEEEKKEEEAPPPPPPPQKPAMSETNKEYKKFLDDRSVCL